MRRDRASKRGRWLSILVAGVIGFLLGDWHATTSRRTELSPAQSVALRFPEAKAGPAVADATTGAPTGAATGMVLGDAQLTLLSPDPMVPLPAKQPAAPAAAPEETSSPSPEAAPAPRPLPITQPQAEVQPRAELKKSAVESASRRGNRPGYMLNDAQIASIKARLHLTSDQERMWPAVEAALRNIAYAKARDAQQHRAPGTAEVASLNPDSAAVQGLKSAAVPLIMSFSDEQKNEVRNLAHVMGLDKLASEL